MKFSCARNDLNYALSIVQRGTSQKVTVESLECIKFQGNNLEGILELISYNLDMGVKTTIKANIEKSGSILIKSNFIREAIRKLPDSELSISIEENNVIIKSGKCQFNTYGFSTSEFPEFPELEYKNFFSISQRVLKDMLIRTLFAVATNDIRIFTTGVLFEIKKNNVQLVSLDGFRLAMRSEIVENSDVECSCIVPGKVLKEISQMIQDVDYSMNIMISKKYIVFETENLIILARLLEEGFFNYKNVIYKKSKHIVKINSGYLYESIERASLIMSVTKMVTYVKLKFDYNILSISCSDSNSSYYDELRISSNMNEFTIAFNIKYLLDALKYCKNEDIILELDTPLLPLIIKSMDKVTFLFMVVPIRISIN